jgi:hypothetical protein
MLHVCQMCIEKVTACPVAFHPATFAGDFNFGQVTDYTITPAPSKKPPHQNSDALTRRGYGNVLSRSTSTNLIGAMHYDNIYYKKEVGSCKCSSAIYAYYVLR